MGWTDERVELLKKLWADGLSASQIAAELGGITRNAVIGKVHRLGLSGRAKSPSSTAPRPRKARSSGHMMRVPRPSMRGNTALAYDYDVEPEPELIEIPLEQRKTLLQLTEKTCRWPVGDPAARTFSSAAGAQRTSCPIAPITAALPTSRRTIGAATSGRSGTEHRGSLSPKFARTALMAALVAAIACSRRHICSRAADMTPCDRASSLAKTGQDLR